MNAWRKASTKASHAARVTRIRAYVFLAIIAALVAVSHLDKNTCVSWHFPRVLQLSD